jgi:hypothetical protein
VLFWKLSLRVESLQTISSFFALGMNGMGGIHGGLQADLVTAIGSPIPQTLYPFLAVLLLIAGLVLTASFFM